MQRGLRLLCPLSNALELSTELERTDFHSLSRVCDLCSESKNQSSGHPSQIAICLCSPVAISLSRFLFDFVCDRTSLYTVYIIIILISQTEIPSSNLDDARSSSSSRCRLSSACEASALRPPARRFSAGAVARGAISSADLLTTFASFLLFHARGKAKAGQRLAQIALCRRDVANRHSRAVPPRQSRSRRVVYRRSVGNVCAPSHESQNHVSQRRQ